MPTETQLRKPFVAELRKAGALVVPYVGSKMGQQGTADIFLAHKFWSGWIEFKGPTTKIEPIQIKFILDMRSRGVNAEVIRLLDRQNFQIEEWTLTNLKPVVTSVRGAYNNSAVIQRLMGI